MGGPGWDANLYSASGVYVALLGSNFGVVKVDEIARKMSCKLVTGCEASWQVLPEPLSL